MMTEKLKKENMYDCKLEYITLMQVIGCVFVIFGHSYPFKTEIPMWILKIREFIYLFHMPLFIWCSAVLQMKTRQCERYTFSLFIKRRAKRILLPYVVLSVIGIIPKSLFSPLLNDSLAISPYSLARSFLVPRENIWGHFWFLPMIFLMGVIGYAIEKKALSANCEKLVWGLTTVMLLPISFLRFEWGAFLGINDLIKYLWIYALGSFAALSLPEKWEDRKTLFKATASLLSALILFFLFASNRLTAIWIAVLMILTMVEFSVWLTEERKLRFDGVWRNTYAVFIVSWPCQLTVEIILERLLGVPVYIIIPGMFISGLIGPLVIIKIILEIDKKLKRKILSPLLGM